MKLDVPQVRPQEQYEHAVIWYRRKSPNGLGMRNDEDEADVASEEKPKATRAAFEGKISVTTSGP